ncbi:MULTISPECIES: hypothetical protein [Clostridium]|uniref:hypothetical protein n=1 Tax=Clostridium TaxID=1485 RepID=UPI0007734A6B|nr:MULTISPECIES: hypothetical protein [Clostridium]AUM95023.1 hypothetical protein RSJ11_07635 [Clostridium sporogenes]AVQ52462.1 hypothetical protein C7M59_06175 [Clostridium botulinum]
MFYNKLEKELFKSLISFYDEQSNNSLTFEWYDNTIVEAYIDTFYETDNGLEMDEDGYEEYDVCLIRINKIINVAKNSLIGIERTSLNKLFEVSYHNLPDKVYDNNNKVIWRRN